MHSTTFLSLFLSFSLSSFPALSLAAGAITYYGVNESGGEFDGAALPGVVGTNYGWPNETTVDIFVDKQGINTFRLPFLLERMCPVATGLGATFDETYWDQFLASVNYITVTKGAFLITDPHNYMRYNNPSGQPSTGSIIGDTTDSSAATTAQYAAFFTEFATRLKGNDKIIFSLMNEPHDMSTELLVTNEHAAITAIRNAGATNLILAAGNGYTGGHSWTQSAGGDPSSEYLQKLVDPGNNLAFEVHEYLDSDFSGSGNVCSQPGPSNLAAVTAWAAQYNFKLFLTEFGAGANQNCYEYVYNMLQYLEENDQWIGWTAWAAGSMWGTADACCGPDTGSMEPNTLTSSGTPGAFDTVWKNAIQPHVPAAGSVSTTSPTSVVDVATTTTSTSALKTTTTTSALKTITSKSTTSSAPSTLSTTTRSALSTLTTTSKSSMTSSGFSTITSSKTSSKASTSSVCTASATSSATSSCAAVYYQCGGIDFTGPTCCVAGTTCTHYNNWYFQCVPNSRKL